LPERQTEARYGERKIFQLTRAQVFRFGIQQHRQWNRGEADNQDASWQFKKCVEPSTRSMHKEASA